MVKVTYFLLLFFSIEIFATNIETRYNILNDNSELKLEYTTQIQYEINKYINDPYMRKVAGIYLFYEPMLQGVFAENDIPVDLSYLCMIESMMNCKASSPVGAMGLWQFMPATGNEYGLHKDYFVNEYYDPVKSTRAAASYLQDRYRSLKDWNLVIVSYNCGEGNVRKAIQKAGSRNIWKIYPYLPKESRNYIVRMYAMRYLMYFGDYHNFYPDKMKYDYTNVIWLNSNEIDDSIKNDSWFQFLNPQFIYYNHVPKNSTVYFIP